MSASTHEMNGHTPAHEGVPVESNHEEHPPADNARAAVGLGHCLFTLGRSVRAKPDLASCIAALQTEEYTTRSIFSTYAGCRTLKDLALTCATSLQGEPPPPLATVSCRFQLQTESQWSAIKLKVGVEGNESFDAEPPTLDAAAGLSPKNTFKWARGPFPWVSDSLGDVELAGVAIYQLGRAALPCAIITARMKATTECEGGGEVSIDSRPTLRVVFAYVPGAPASYLDMGVQHELDADEPHPLLAQTDEGGLAQAINIARKRDAARAQADGRVTASVRDSMLRLYSDTNGEINCQEYIGRHIVCDSDMSLIGLRPPATHGEVAAIEQLFDALGRPAERAAAILPADEAWSENGGEVQVRAVVFDVTHVGSGALASRLHQTEDRLNGQCASADGVNADGVTEPTHEYTHLFTALTTRLLCPSASSQASGLSTLYDIVHDTTKGLFEGIIPTHTNVPTLRSIDDPVAWGIGGRSPTVGGLLRFVGRTDEDFNSYKILVNLPEEDAQSRAATFTHHIDDLFGTYLFEENKPPLRSLPDESVDPASDKYHPAGRVVAELDKLEQMQEDASSAEDDDGSKDDAIGTRSSTISALNSMYRAALERGIVATDAPIRTSTVLVLRIDGEYSPILARESVLFVPRSPNMSKRMRQRMRNRGASYAEITPTTIEDAASFLLGGFVLVVVEQWRGMKLHSLDLEHIPGASLDEVYHAAIAPVVVPAVVDPSVEQLSTDVSTMKRTLEEMNATLKSRSTTDESLPLHIAADMEYLRKGLTDLDKCEARVKRMLTQH
jgi:hypothetical protein